MSSPSHVLCTISPSLDVVPLAGHYSNSNANRSNLAFLRWSRLSVRPGQVGELSAKSSKVVSPARAKALDLLQSDAGKLDIVEPTATLDLSQYASTPKVQSKEGSAPHQRKDHMRLTDMVKGLATDAKERMVTAIMDILFKPTGDTNIYFQGNFGPVPEIGGRVPARVIEGSIPPDFPVGVYIRNGPNPGFGTENKTSPFGKSNLHWFEGDGMIHGTYFGPDGQITYQNKYIETDGYKVEKARNRRLWLNTLEGGPKAVTTGYLFNQMRFGKVNKPTCNTAVFEHAGRVFVNAEGDKPLQINPSDLSTVGLWDWDGKWDRPFTSHPKVVRDTNEMVVFGFSAKKPYYEIGIVSADGERLTHKCDLEFEKCTFTHEIGITKRYNLILDWPLIVDVDRLMQGGNLMSFDGDTIARVGIMPRYGDATTVKWFNVETNYTFHIINSYEDGDEVVLHGCRARASLLAPKEGMDILEWSSRAFTNTRLEDGMDPQVDGAMFTHAHEWRFNLKTGETFERDLTDDTFSMDMPKINEKFLGYKNEYAYAQVVDLKETIKSGNPKYGKLVKLHLNKKVEKDYVKTELYDPGPQVFLSEPLFVENPNPVDEDDGWIVTYAHNEITDISEVHILDAHKFSGKPLARIQLPQRVPYGFHSLFVHGVK